MRYGDIIHYMWSEEAGLDHSAAMFIMTPSAWQKNDLAVMLPLSDEYHTFSLQTPIVAKIAAMWRPCTAACPFNPEYEGANS